MAKIVKATFKVLNSKGLHTRPSMELVKCASLFSSNINLHCRTFVVNAKSLLGILMLAAAKGTKITVEATGDDAEEAVASILALASREFNMQY